MNCITSLTGLVDAAELQTSAKREMDQLAKIWNSDCRDLPTHGSTVQPEVVSAVLLADAIGQMPAGSCAGGCPDSSRPLCKAGVCVELTCADAAPLCNNASADGGVARMFCPVMCGCDDVTSSLLLLDARDGCPGACEAKRDAQLTRLPCVDAGPGDPKLAAFTKALVSVVAQHAATTHREELSRLYGKFNESGCDFLHLEGSKAFTEFHPCGYGIPHESGATLRLFEHFCPGLHECMLHTHTCTNPYAVACPCMRLSDGVTSQPWATDNTVTSCDK